MSFENEAKALQGVSLRKQKHAYTNDITVENRYGNAISKLAELAKRKRGDTLVVHLVGVGGKQGPQLREVIGALKGTGKRIDMHVMDYDKELLGQAMAAAQAQFPDAKITAHLMHEGDPEFDIVQPVALPRKRADIAVCTNVLMHESVTTRHAGLYHLASSVKKGGYLLVDARDVENLRAYPKAFGLEQKSEPTKELPHMVDAGVIFKKTRKERPFDEIWEKVK
jgi:hypothetical protein